MITDLRSDTVTRPTPAMLNAMLSAQVGDDVFGDDPTVIKLEKKTAAIFNKEAGLFCPSGTMANQIAVKVHTQPGDEVICDRTAHVYNYEGGGIAFNSACSVKLIDGNRGRFNASDVEESLNPDDIHSARSRLVVVENTSNKGGGSCWKLEDIAAIAEVCRANKLKYHLDGARIFNALTATRQDPFEVGQHFDSISLCFSKGLGAPVGSVLLGSEEFIRQARRVRKVLGGAMRQAGYLAAGGIYALDNHISRLSEDHARAGILADILRDLSYVDEVISPETNILIFKLSSDLTTSGFLAYLKDNQILAAAFGPQMIRFVTHLDITEEMMAHCKEVLRAYRN